jgi:cobyrinic acid a,c-diamide synthase
MGLHDRNDGRTDHGSTTQVAKMLGAPVVLGVDASKCK